MCDVVHNWSKKVRFAAILEMAQRVGVKALARVAGVSPDAITKARALGVSAPAQTGALISRDQGTRDGSRGVSKDFMEWAGCSRCGGGLRRRCPEIHGSPISASLCSSAIALGLLHPVFVHAMS